MSTQLSRIKLTPRISTSINRSFSISICMVDYNTISIIIKYNHGMPFICCLNTSNMCTGLNTSISK